MSKTVARSSEGLLKNSLIGAIIALVSYVVLQCPVALLIHYEILAVEMLYPMVCVAAGLSSFLGCIFSVMRAGEGGVLSATAVALVFLAVTAVVGLLSGETGVIAAGLTGIGGAMVAGGLLAAAVPAVLKRGYRRDKVRGRRNKRR